MFLVPSVRLGWVLGSASAGAELRLRLWYSVLLLLFLSPSWGGGGVNRTVLLLLLSAELLLVVSQ